ncbi:MAG: Ig-like domain repeat protein [Acidimicrobiales bacterium]
MQIVAVVALLTAVASLVGVAAPTASASPVLTAPSIKQTSGNAIVGKAKTVRITATGNPKPTITETGALPTGMNFVSGPGSAVITGTPGPGTGADYNIAVTATNSQGSDTENYDLTVQQNPVFPPGFCPAPMTVGQYTNVQQSVTAYPAFFGISENLTLPDGVSFNQPNPFGDPDLGILSGTPSPGSGGKYGLQYTSDANNTTGSLHCKLIVDEAPTFTDAGTAVLTTGSPLTTPVAIGGTPGYPKAVTLATSGATPTGLTAHTAHNNKGFTVSLKGTPAAGSAGVYPITVTADNGISSLEEFVVVVRSPTVTPALTTVTLSAEPDPVPYGASQQTYVATVSGGSAPSGFVQFSLGGTLTTVPVVDGQASFTTPGNLDVNDYTVTASYSGDATNAASSATEDLTVSPATTTLVLNGPASTPFGVSATFTGTVTCTPACGTTPTGQINFGDGNPIELVNGTATYQTDPTLTPQVNEITATFTSFDDSPGDFATSTASASYDIGPVSLAAQVGDGTASDGTTAIANGDTVTVPASSLNEFSVQLSSVYPQSGTPPGPLAINVTVGTTDETSALGLGTGSQPAPASDPGTGLDDYFWTLPAGDLSSLAPATSATVTVTYGGSDDFDAGSLSFTLDW